MLIHVAGFNLGLLMRKRFGVGTPRGLQGRMSAATAAIVALIDLIGELLAVPGYPQPAKKRVPAVIAAATRLSATRSGERRSELDATDVLAALEAALEAMQIPALIADPRGAIVCSNASARAVIGGEPAMTSLSAPANNVGFLPRRWEVTPIRGVGQKPWSLMILRSLDSPHRCRWNLTPRQNEVLNLVVKGLTNTGIAETLGIRLGTVEFHISAIFDKVGVNNRAALIATVMGYDR